MTESRWVRGHGGARAKYAAASCAIIAVLAACSQTESGDAIHSASSESVGSVSEAIANGSPAPGPDNVVRVLYQKTDGTAGACTAVLVSPLHLLTAAHCVN